MANVVPFPATEKPRAFGDLLGQRIEPGAPTSVAAPPLQMRGAAPPAVARLQADTSELRLFVETIFRNCVGCDGWISLRAFEHEGGGAAVVNRWTPFDGTLVPTAVEAATAIANRPFVQRAVFSPPVCLFGDEGVVAGKRVASESNVVCAPVITVELDERPTESLATLKAVLGDPTLVVASGGEWYDPADKLELNAQPKRHAYWRLRQPATSPQDRTALRQARSLAARLVSADTSAVPLNHPMRWTGSWHTKREPAVLCRVVGGDHRRDVELPWAIEALQEALAAAGLEPGGAASIARGERRGFKTRQEWSASSLADAARLIPNDGLHWNDWNRIGMAFYDAAHASVDGLDAFHVWSEKDDRYDADTTDGRWSHWHSSPPSDLSAGTLLFECRKVDPNFQNFAASAADYFEKTSELPNDGEPDGDDDADEGLSLPPFVAELNERHAFVMNDGRGMIVNVEDGARVSFSTRMSFFERYANDKIMRGQKPVSKAEAWWEHPGRRQFLGGVDFDPEGVAPSVFNMWRGFPPLVGGEAGEAGCPMILRHIREVICDGDATSADYLLGWLAHMLQRPGDKPGVAIVLKGKKGVGKDTLGEFLKPVLGGYYAMVSDHNHVVGQFNGHVAGKLLLHVEEAILAGDRKGESVLKSLITAPDITIERKGIDAFMVKSRLRVLMTSNERRVVAATEDERRFFVLNVSDRRRGDRAWFARLRAELQGTGPACLAAFLRSIDLSGFDVRDVPDTGALLDQKLLGLPPLERWIYEVLQAGDLGGHLEWPQEVATARLLQLFQEATKNDPRARSVSASYFGKTIQHVLKVPPVVRRRVDDRRCYTYSLPPLAEARSAFCDWAGQTVEWDE